MSKSKLTYGLHWFRRDLRVISNPALMQNLLRHEGRVVGIFFFDSKFLNRSDFSNNRFAFFLKTLTALRHEMQNSGGDLLVLDRQPAEGFAQVFATLQHLKTSLPGLVSFNRDYEPFARNRDTQIQTLCHAHGVETLTKADHLILEPHQILKPGGGTYQVFTPFYKTWIAQLEIASSQERIATAEAGLKALHFNDLGKNPDQLFCLKWRDILGKSAPLSAPLIDQLETFEQTNNKKVTVKIPIAGEREAFRQLIAFKTHLDEYETGRDYPAENKTSNLSIYLKNGSLTTAQVFAYLGHLPQAKPFLRQLVWREFYYHILFHHPRVETESFKPKYRDLDWKNSTDWFDAWKEGRTGYPIVDAGMRQLSSTGLMHNRVRMIVASFLTKDLLIDWRWGEQWFMQSLLDGDLASNNGGWQWAASTGCDPQPYFRIFNPELQSRRFDPKGTYLRKYVPELSACSDQEIHRPVHRGALNTYPPPIVDHSKQKLESLNLFRSKVEN